MKLETRSEVLAEGKRFRVWMETGPVPGDQPGIQSLLRVASVTPEGLLLAERIVDRTTQRGAKRTQRAIDLLHRVSRSNFHPRARGFVDALPEPGPTL